MGPETPKGCRLWLGCVNEWGRGIFIEFTKPVRRATSAPRFSYRFFIGPVHPDLFPMPDCGEPLCVEPAHLILMTRSQVAKRSLLLRPRPHLKELVSSPAFKAHRAGMLNGNCRYPDEKIRQVRQERATGAKIQVIAMRHRMPVSTVWFICTRRVG